MCCGVFTPHALYIKFDFLKKLLYNIYMIKIRKGDNNNDKRKSINAFKCSFTVIKR